MTAPVYRTNTIRCVPFSPQAFTREVLDASGASEGGTTNLQSRYLASYLDSDLGVRGLLIEDHYIDRHFIEEYSAYYSRCLATVLNSCRRIHAFTRDLDDSVLDALITRAASGDAARVHGELQASYCGFIVVRPLPTAPIGRTVLRYPDNRTERKYLPTLGYSVHLLGFELDVRGIAFQQQDVAVAACATTAIWTALQRALRTDGGRAPTPSAITHAAMRYDPLDGRPLPGRSGLKINQVCDALRAFHIAPEVVAANNAPTEFLRYVNVYVRSGIPVILCLHGTHNGTAGHAVTIVGYRESEIEGPTLRHPFLVAEGTGEYDEDLVDVTLVNQSYDRVFVHDDRIGPYASARLIMMNANADGDRKAVQFQIKLPSGVIETRQVQLAVVPLYPKLRSSAEDLWSNAFEIRPPVSRGSKVSLELFFSRAGSYTSSLYSRSISSRRSIQFQRGASLSRYVGVARWYVEGTPVLDTVWDTTDVRRKNRYDKGSGLLAVVALHPNYADFTDRCAEIYGVLNG